MANPLKLHKLLNKVQIETGRTGKDGVLATFTTLCHQKGPTAPGQGHRHPERWQEVAGVFRQTLSQTAGGGGPGWQGQAAFLCPPGPSPWGEGEKRQQVPGRLGAGRGRGGSRCLAEQNTRLSESPRRSREAGGGCCLATRRGSRERARPRWRQPHCEAAAREGGWEGGRLGGVQPQGAAKGDPGRRSPDGCVRQRHGSWALGLRLKDRAALGLLPCGPGDPALKALGLLASRPSGSWLGPCMVSWYSMPLRALLAPRFSSLRQASWPASTALSSFSGAQGEGMPRRCFSSPVAQICARQGLWQETLPTATAGACRLHTRPSTMPAHQQ